MLLTLTQEQLIMNKTGPDINLLTLFVVLAVLMTVAVQAVF